MYVHLAMTPCVKLSASADRQNNEISKLSRLEDASSYAYAYAISSWYSFLTKAQIAQINSLFKRAYKYGYVKLIITAKELSASYDDHLFHKAFYGNHCLHHLLPIAKSTNYVLRDVGHTITELHKRTFINRMLFRNCY